MKKLLRLIVIVAFIVLIGLIYVAGGTSSQDTRLEYQVKVINPGSGKLEVSLTIYPPSRPFLDLYLRDPIQDGKVRLSNFVVESDAKSLTHWQAFPYFADMERIWLGFSTQPVQIRYVVDAQWNKGSDSPRSYLGPNFGYLRAMVVLYTPFTWPDVQAMLNQNDTFSLDSGQAKLNFTLPKDWTLVSPWGSGEQAMPVSALRNVYFGIGKFQNTTLNSFESAMLVGSYPGINNQSSSDALLQVPSLFHAMQEMTGFAPLSRAPYWAVTILPEDPIHGGAAGTNSLVVCDDLVTISHEIFHWWNGRTLQFTPDANWIEEGFTTYYAGKALAHAGIWTTGDQGSYLRKLTNQLWGNRPPQPVNLVEASNRLKKQGNSQDYLTVYHGGALIAASLDERLHQQGKSLDQIWAVIQQGSSPVSTEGFLQSLAQVGGQTLADETKEILYGRK
jgi:hypothetical protein